jgi:thiamine-phosphate pyrophosphorylase
MRARYPRHDPWPSTWLLTDERQGDAFWPALRRLPRGSGIIVRHYSLGARDRRRLLKRIRGIARARGLIMLLSGTADRAMQADSIYLGSPARKSIGLRTAMGVHDLKEIRQAERSGARLLMLSPLFPTRSHPSGRALGIPRFAALARATRLPVIALGGVDARHAPLLNRIGAYGWAGIDAFIPKARKRQI